MVKKSILIFVLTLLLTPHTFAAQSTSNLSSLEAIQETSNALWKVNDDIRYYALPNNLALGAVGFVFGGLNLNDSFKPNHQTRYQGVAGALYLGAGLSGLSASLLHGLGENSVDNYRWHRGLTGDTFLLGGSAALLRGLDSVKEACVPADGSCQWRTPHPFEPWGGAAMIATGLWSFLTAIWDFQEQWALMALRDQLANAQHLTLQEREVLEEKALRSLKQNEQASSAVFYFAGAMMFSGGLAGVVATQFSDFSTANQIAYTTLGATVAGLGAYFFYLPFSDDPYPLHNGSHINIGVGQSSYTGDALLMVTGRF